MNNQIHPSSVIDPQAKIGNGNFIGPFCYIGPQVVMGDNNRLEAHSSIGTPAEHRDYFHEPAGPVTIGDNCIFREFTTVHGGTSDTTVLQNNVTMLRGSHIGHDAIIRSRSHISPNVCVGGHCILGEGANIGMAASIHQHRAIGAFSMIGMNSTVTRDIPPFVIAFGNPTDIQRINRIGLERSGVTTSDLNLFEAWFQGFKHFRGTLLSLNHEYKKFIEEYLDDCAVFHSAAKAA